MTFYFHFFILLNPRFNKIKNKNKKVVLCQRTSVVEKTRFSRLPNTEDKHVTSFLFIEKIISSYF